ncbi:serine/threonine-protein kinase spk-1 isoform X2 [Helianthus annuus]|uniref:serine/threonine-protein kinase spk-1 isoform X2 n=1 Tax=Helianthus annuus TaxID=4232 RepID=UPI001652C8AE|nr:serine/threonine-protein kinase spk-1 isoform X2 [Helianthus annuus]
MSCSSSSASEDDEDFDSYRKGGYHAVRVGDSFASGRFIAQRKLGWGQFSTVWLAYDTQTSKYVALKIQKSAPEFVQAALHEIEILSALTENDPKNEKCVVQLVDHFKHRGPNGQHLCMVLEFLGDSILHLIRYNRYKGLNLYKVREVCKCILIGLDYIHRELRIIHTDLKPENILLMSTVNPSKDPIRSNTAPILERPEGSLAGGGAVNVIEKKLKQRARRAVAKIAAERRGMIGGCAPEVKPERCLDGIDFRCKIVDLGNACWAKPGPGFSEDEDHLALMMELLGKMPKKIATGGGRSKDYFDRHGDLKRIRRLKHSSLSRLLIDKFKYSETDAREFAEFLNPILDFDPEKRPTAQQCLQHPWLCQTAAKTAAEKSNS